MTTFDPEFYHVYTITRDGVIGDSPESAPNVYMNEDDCTAYVDNDEWYLIQGYTRQLLGGAIMHPSEQWGDWAIHELKALADDEENTVLHFVVVEVGTEEYGIPDDDLIGWAIACKLTYHG